MAPTKQPSEDTPAAAVEDTPVVHQTTDQKVAAEKRRAAAEDADNASRVNALLAERRGYVVRGLDDRVKQVDAELKRHGHRDRD